MNTTASPLDSNACQTPSWRQFSLRLLFAELTLWAGLFALLGFAFANDGNPIGIIALLVAVPIAPASIGFALPPAFGRDAPERRRRFAVLYAASSGAAVAPFIIGIEWGPDHPGPAPDVAYVVLAVLRCLALGGLVGWVVTAFLDVAAGDAICAFSSRFQTRRLAAVAVAVATLCLLWLPAAPWYRQRLAVNNLRQAIIRGPMGEVPARIVAARSVDAEADAASITRFLALQTSSPHVRTRALLALKLLGEAAYDFQVDFKQSLNDALAPLLEDEDEAVRRATAELLDGWDEK